MPQSVYSHVANASLAALLLAIVASWFVRGPMESEFAAGYLTLACTTSALAGVALLRPPPRRRDQRWWVFGLCILSITYVFGYRFDTELTEPLRLMIWGRLCLQVLANMMLLSLGRSYAMLPALRGVRTGLFYAWVRHPVYAVYMLADLALVLLQPSLWNAGVASVGFAVFFLRARLEESVLDNDPVYVSYKRAVPWRFVPGVY